MIYWTPFIVVPHCDNGEEVDTIARIVSTASLWYSLQGALSEVSGALHLHLYPTKG